MPEKRNPHEPPVRPDMSQWPENEDSRFNLLAAAVFVLIGVIAVAIFLWWR